MSHGSRPMRLVLVVAAFGRILCEEACPMSADQLAPKHSTFPVSPESDIESLQTLWASIDWSNTTRALSNAKAALPSLRGDVGAALHVSRFCESIGEFELGLRALEKGIEPLRGIISPFVSFALSKLQMVTGRYNAALSTILGVLIAAKASTDSNHPVFPIDDTGREADVIWDMQPALCTRLGELVVYAAGDVNVGDPWLHKHTKHIEKGAAICSSFRGDGRDAEITIAEAVIHDALGHAGHSTFLYNSIAHSGSQERTRRDHSANLAAAQARAFARKSLRDRTLGAGQVDRRSNLNITEFLELYVYAGRPVILTNEREAEELSRTWTMPWLRTSYGHQIVRVLNSSDIEPYYSGSHHASGRRPTPVNMTLNDYLDKLNIYQIGHSENVKVPDPPYLISAEPFKGLYKEYETPHFATELHPYTGRSIFRFSERKRRKRALFFVGGAGTGTYWHQHTHAFNMVASGRKQWYLMAPFLNWAPDVGVMRTWEQSNNARTLQPYVLKCEQRAGEILYVPAHWGHATQNMETTLGIAIEAGELY